MTNKTERDIEQAISELKNGSEARKTESKKETNMTQAKKAAADVRAAIEKNGGESIVVDKTGKVSIENPANSKAKRGTKIAKKMTKRLTDNPVGRGRPANISSEEFQKLWESASSMDVLAETLASRSLFAGRERTNIKLYCSMRAANLRKTGVELKKFPRGRKAK